MCEQQRLRPACAYTQTDQSLCWSLKYSMTVKLLTEPHLRFLSLKGGCTGWFESTLVKIPHCWKPRVVAQLLVCPDFILRIKPELRDVIPRIEHISREHFNTRCMLRSFSYNKVNDGCSRRPFFVIELLFSF